MEIMLRKSNNIPVKLLGYARQRLGDLADTAKKKYQAKLQKEIYNKRESTKNIVYKVVIHL